MKKFYALTLIETLIAILVFWIGILVVLQWLSQTLRNQDYANMQIKSAFLAREWIELMFNLRDANYHKELPWDCIFNPVTNLAESYDEDVNPFCIWKFWDLEEDTAIKIWIWSDEYIYAETGSLDDDFDAIFSWFQLFLNTWNDVLNGNTWFVYSYSGKEEQWTRFARYLVITWVVADEPLDKDTLLKVESHVLYKKWHLTWEKVMETFIGNYEF